MDSSGRFVARHVATLPKSGIRDFFAIVSKMKDAVSLGIGEPDFVTPYHIREAAIASLEKGRTSYTDNRGTQQFREEISRYVARNYGPEYDPETEILGTIGVVFGDIGTSPLYAFKESIHHMNVARGGEL